ncbi:MAG: hypothetical protein ACE5EG_10125 [Thermoanaerobaculia bacterium]
MVGPPSASTRETAGAELPIGRIVEKVATANDPGQQYALYLPTGYGAGDKPWPILIVLDPRGRAVPGVERFLPAAETHGYVVISSYQSRSDTLRQVNVDALDALLTEVQERFSHDNRRLYLAGMSGTAHAAWRFAQFLGEHVAGVIAAGGGVQTRTQGPPGGARFAWYGIAGTADFNYQEVKELEEHLLAEGIDHRIAIFEGRHGWPPYEYTNRALDWMELQAIKRGLAPPNPALVDAELASARQAAESADDPLVRLRRHRDLVRDFEGLSEMTADLAAVRELEADPRTNQRCSQERKLANAERAYLSTRYGRWVPEMRNTERRPPTVKEALVALRIESLRKRAADRDDPSQAHSAQRTLENVYVGVGFYFPQEFEKARDHERMVRSLQIAVAIFPDRVGGHWRLAQACVLARRHDLALEALRSATAFGNVDLERLETDSAWEPLRGRPEWARLLAEIKKTDT